MCTQANLYINNSSFRTFASFIAANEAELAAGEGHSPHDITGSLNESHGVPQNSYVLIAAHSQNNMHRSDRKTPNSMVLAYDDTTCDSQHGHMAVFTDQVLPSLCSCILETASV